MAKRSFHGSQDLAAGSSGFSLVELLVALVFTGLLMAGMAQVFQSSLSTFYTSGEILSSARRNRASLDLLYDDMNSATMYLTSIADPPPEVAPTNPAFYVLPNQTVAGAGAGDPGSATYLPAGTGTGADELYFYMDQPMAFEGTIATSGKGQRTSLNTTITDAANKTFTVDCGDTSYANLFDPTIPGSIMYQAQHQTPPSGLSMIIKDAWQTLYFTTASVSGKIVTIVGAPQKNVGVTGIGFSGDPVEADHIFGSGVLFFLPSQMVRYSIKMKTLDPQNPAGIPCLVRDQGAYSAGGFVADASQESIITENVSGFKVYLSANSGQTWAGQTAAGLPKTYSGFAAGWTGGIRADLDAQLTASGRLDDKTGAKITTVGNEQWFRKTPTLVRLDITTRTATKRTEYYDPANPTVPAPYRNLVQSLVIVPRHFGLPVN